MDVKEYLKAWGESIASKPHWDEIDGKPISK